MIMNCESSNYILTIVAIGVSLFSFLRDLVHLYDFRFQQNEMLARLDKMQKYLKQISVKSAADESAEESADDESEDESAGESEDESVVDESADESVVDESEDESVVDESEDESEDESADESEDEELVDNEDKVITKKNYITYKFYTSFNFPEDYFTEGQLSQDVNHFSDLVVDQIREGLASHFQVLSSQQTFPPQEDPVPPQEDPVPPQEDSVLLQDQ